MKWHCGDVHLRQSLVLGRLYWCSSLYGSQWIRKFDCQILPVGEKGSNPWACIPLAIFRDFLWWACWVVVPSNSLGAVGVFIVAVIL